MTGSRRALRMLVSLLLAAAAGACLMMVSAASARAATGDLLASITASNPEHCTVNVGVAFDGQHLLVSCVSGNDNGSTHIDYINPSDGSLFKSLQVNLPGVAAIAYDAGRGKLWACDSPTGGNSPDSGTEVYLINPNTGAATDEFPTAGCWDGLAYDGADGSLWVSPDQSDTIYHYANDGALIKSFSGLKSELDGFGNSGIAVGGTDLYLSNADGGTIYTTPKDFSTQPSKTATEPDQHIEDMECDTATFAPKDAMWVISAFDRTLNAYEIPAGSCGSGGQNAPRTINVTTTDDAGTGAGDCLTTDQDCSLRQAITAENATDSGGDTVALGSGRYALTQGKNLDITKSVTLVGDGVAATSIDGSQNQQTRILRVDGGANVSIERLAFTGGDDGNDENCCHGSTFNLNGGGAIFNASGNLNLQNVAFSDSTSFLGAAISNNATLNMQDVSFTRDRGGIGGGLFSRGIVTGNGLTFESEATDCCDDAAVYLYAGTASLTNTTVVGSGGASSMGGGIHNAGATLTLKNDTLSNNVRGSLETDTGGSTSVENTIIANGSGGGDCVARGLDTGDGTTDAPITTDLGGNLDQDKSCGLTDPSDQPGVDPHLASIADNGGPTRTEALVFGSPAFGAANGTDCPEVDQRHEPRTRPCDIGAFEAHATGQQPSAVSASPDKVGQTQADLQANIDLGGEPGGLHFLWGTSSGTLTNVTPEAGEGVIDGVTLRSQTLQGLKPGTTYFYEAVADNASGSNTSDTVEEFTTAAGSPVVSPVSPGRATDTTAVLDFSIDPQGADTTYVVQYGPGTGYGQQTDPVLVPAAKGQQDLEATLTDLTPGTTYHVNVHATNGVQPDGDSGDARLTTERQLQGTVGTPLELDDSKVGGFICATQASVDWGDGKTDDGVPVDCTPATEESPARYSLTASHTYAAPRRYPIEISYDNGDTSELFAQITGPQTQPPPTGTQGTGTQGTGNQPQPSPPVVSGGAPTSKTSDGASVTGTVNPEGVPTTAHFEYGLDLSQRGPGADTTLYDQQTAPQQVGSDVTDHTVTATLTGLIPGALYHVRLVAANSAGTTFGGDQAFTAAQAAAPPPPVLGKSEDAKPVSGRVFIRTPTGQFIPLTGATRIPTGSVIDALHGSLQLLAAVGKGKTEHGIFGGAVFKLTQARTGLTTLRLLENAFKGAPSFAICKAHKAADATIASSKTLQLLKASAHGKFRTKGRYSAATVRGTKWTVADRCDGTLTHDITHSVAVTDFVRHKTIILHAGQSYLAKARKPQGP